MFRSQKHDPHYTRNSLRAGSAMSFLYHDNQDEALLAARVKVNKARRAIHTNAGNSCFCYSPHQFNETWRDQMENKEVLENCNLVGLEC